MEAVERVTARPCHPSRFKLEEGLVCRDLACLRGPCHALELLEGLPAEPTELVVVPHIHERPAGARVLQIRIVQVCTIDGSVVVDGGGDMKVANLFPGLVADEVAYAAIVHALRP